MFVSHTQVGAEQKMENAIKKPSIFRPSSFQVGNRKLDASCTKGFVFFFVLKFGCRTFPHSRRFEHVPQYFSILVNMMQRSYIRNTRLTGSHQYLYDKKRIIEIGSKNPFVSQTGSMFFFGSPFSYQNIPVIVNILLWLAFTPFWSTEYPNSLLFVLLFLLVD